MFSVINNQENANQNHNESQSQWHTPMTAALGGLRQKDHDFKTSLGYIARHCLQNKNQNPQGGITFNSRNNGLLIQ
jgi:hypothetical protein